MTSRFVNNLIAALLLGFRTDFVQRNVLRHTAAVVYVKELLCATLLLPTKDVFAFIYFSAKEQSR